MGVPKQLDKRKLTRAESGLPEDGRYLCIEVRDALGRRAGTNPFFLRQLLCSAKEKATGASAHRPQRTGFQLLPSNYTCNGDATTGRSNRAQRWHPGRYAASPTQPVSQQI